MKDQNRKNSENTPREKKKCQYYDEEVLTFFLLLYILLLYRDTYIIWCIQLGTLVIEIFLIFQFSYK